MTPNPTVSRTLRAKPRKAGFRARFDCFGSTAIRWVEDATDGKLVYASRPVSVAPLTLRRPPCQGGLRPEAAGSGHRV
jgi:hypothetical protein